MKIYDKNTGLTFIGAPMPQGDVDLVPIEKIPETAIRQSVDPETGQYILAHSETGHHHVMDRVDNIEYYEAANDPFGGFLRVVESPANLVHLREHHTHAPWSIPPGDYYVSRGREYTPEGLRRSQD